MALELGAIPLAALAGVLGVISPCVWPLVPVVMSSAGVGGRRGPWLLALGLGLSFALGGTLLTFLLLRAGLDPVLYRGVSAVLLVAVALTLLVKPLGDALANGLSLVSGRLPGGGARETGGASGQFIVGGLLGLVWLPCVGPTLGAAIALASAGQDMGLAFLVMLAFGLATAGTVLVGGLLSAKAMNRWRPGLLANAVRAKQVLGALLLALGVAVLLGWDKWLEAAALAVLPDWALGF